MQSYELFAEIFLNRAKKIFPTSKLLVTLYSFSYYK